MIEDKTDNGKEGPNQDGGDDSGIDQKDRDVGEATDITGTPGDGNAGDDSDD
jgi:hypothetical protein